MALHNLLAAIEAEARAEVSRLRAERNTEAAGILDEAKRRSADLVADAVRTAERAERRGGELRLRTTREAVGTRLRDAHETTYRQIADRVRAELGAVRERADYPTILAALLAEARTVTPATTTVRVHPLDEPLVRRMLADDPGARIEATLDSAGGVEVSDGAGTIVRNTVEDRFTNAELALRGLVGGVLALGSPEHAPAPPQPQEVLA
jgi:vacuolar-type H+-ATPase subunit E/Vma4